MGGRSHGRTRAYIAYKAAAEGIETPLQDEAYTSQTRPVCGHRHKPTGRVYRCPACGFCGARDGVGAVNIRSKYLGGVAGCGLGVVKYRHPLDQHPGRARKRSRRDMAHVAGADPLGRKSQEAAAL